MNIVASVVWRLRRLPSFKDRVEFENVHIESMTPLSVWAIINGERINVPQSQIDDDSEAYKTGDTGTLIVSEWWAIERKLV
jgi:hypothetical protein